MSLKSKIYIFGACILVAAFLGTIFGFYIKFRYRSANPPPVSTSIGNSSKEANAQASTLTSHRVMPETPLPATYFKLTIQTSDADGEQAAGSKKSGAQMAILKYTEQETNDGILLTFYSFESKSIQHGAVIEDTLMTRDKLMSQQGDQTNESFFDELISQWQTMLANTFATNFCKIVRDADHNELGRHLLSRARFALIGEGNFNLLRLMQGPYYPGTDRWQSTNRVSLADAFVINCPVQYTRTSGAGNEINVNGSFAKDEINPLQDGMAYKNVSCSLTGKESFDTAVGEYTSGTMTLQYKFQVFRDGAQVAAINRTVELSLEQVTTQNK